MHDFAALDTRQPEDESQQCAVRVERADRDTPNAL
jgi:hypothetical protein